MFLIRRFLGCALRLVVACAMVESACAVAEDEADHVDPGDVRDDTLDAFSDTFGDGDVADGDVPDAGSDAPAEDSEAIDVAADADAEPDDGADADSEAEADADAELDADGDVDAGGDAEADADVAGDDGPGGSGTCASPLVMPGPGFYTGDTTGLPALHDPTCSGWEQPSTEQIWILTIASPVTVRFQLHPTAHWDPSIYVHHDCAVDSGTTLDFCADEVMWDEDEDLSATLAVGDWYVFVDGYISSGPYELTVTFL